MASFRSQSRSGLRREAYLPLPSATRIPFLLVIATLIVLVAAVADTVIWSQGAERRQLIQRVQNAEVEAELLRFENERLRQRLLERSLATPPSHAPDRVQCDPSDPLCGL